VRGRGVKEGVEGGKGGAGGKGGEMTQTMYAHMNKIKIKKVLTMYQIYHT
jgi:hypothetical protein